MFGISVFIIIFFNLTGTVLPFLISSKLPLFFIIISIVFIILWFLLTFFIIFGVLLKKKS